MKTPASRLNGIGWLLLLGLVPFVWLYLSYPGKPGEPGKSAFLAPINNTVMNWRFKLRGERYAPVKIVYANLDGWGISLFGERPWHGSQFANLARILFEEGKARSVGFDFIFSELSTSAMVTEASIRESNAALGEVIMDYPNIVLAANYTGILLPYTPAEREKIRQGDFVPERFSIMPLLYMDNVPAHETFPEMPSFPIIDFDYGTVGLISTDDLRNPDAVPRWIPLFTESEGPFETMHLMRGYARFLGLPYDQILSDGETVILLDQNGQIVIEQPLYRKRTFYHFAIELARQYLGVGPEAVTLSADELTIFDQDGLPRIRVPMVDGQLVEINWLSGWTSPKNTMTSIGAIFQHYINLTRGGGEVKEEAKAFFSQFNDAIVLVGPVDPTLQDLAPTPFESNPVPKVGVHGNALKMFFSGLYIKRLDFAWHVVITLALTLLVTALALYNGRGSAVAKALSVLTLLGYTGFVFWVFARYHLVVPLVSPVGAAFTTAFIGTVIRLLGEERQRSRIKGMFGTYVSPDLVDRMVESGQEPQLGGVDSEITCFFSDVQSFSMFSEKLPPARLVDLMNEYLSAMTEIIQEENGTLDKYIGDAIVAMFGAPVALPDHAYRACVAACRMQEHQAVLREKWKAEGDAWPAIVSAMRTRIGLNSGFATVGNMGSNTRFNYTMMGDAVNLAARCESGAKSLGVYTMVTDDTRRAAEVSGQSCFFRELDMIVVKGRQQPVKIHELMGFREKLPESMLACADYYDRALAAYRARDWANAIELFQKAVALEPFQAGRDEGVSTNPSSIMLARALALRENPPGEDWDGVFIMTSK